MVLAAAFFILAHMQHLHEYHTELTENFSIAIPCSLGFAFAGMVCMPFAFLSIKLDHF